MLPEGCCVERWRLAQSFPAGVTTSVPGDKVVT
jgi:hypothetical protein